MFEEILIDLLQSMYYNVQVRILIERYGLSRKNLMSFSAGGKKHSHDVVKALYYDLMRRVESGMVTLAEPVSIVQAVMPRRRGWRGVGGEEDRINIFKRYTMLCVFTAWRWYLTRLSAPATSNNMNKTTRYEHTCSSSSRIHSSYLYTTYTRTL